MQDMASESPINDNSMPHYFINAISFVDKALTTFHAVTTSHVTRVKLQPLALIQDNIL